MRQADIGWARTDFDWTTVQPRQDGPWDYSLIDRTVQSAEEGGITILPILGYDVAWARPAYKHLDAWRQYVRNIVSRYKGRLHYWEVWNEPDLEQFWKDTPDAAHYTLLLKAAYEEIKAVDPSAQVLLGGVSGIPMDYLKGIYDAGGGAFFDIMNVHPYRYPLTPEASPLKDDLYKLRQLMPTTATPPSPSGSPRSAGRRTKMIRPCWPISYAPVLRPLPRSASTGRWRRWTTRPTPCASRSPMRRF